VASGVADENPPADLVELGVVRGAFGVKGWVRIAPHADDAEVLLASRTWWLLGRTGPRAIAVEQVRRHAGALVAKWAGCENKEAAEALRDTPVAVSRSAFPPAGEDEYYWLDLVGATVVNRAGVELGRVTALRSNGAQDLIEVTGESGGESGAVEPAQVSKPRVLLVPLVEEYIDRVDIAGRRIDVDWEPDW
jgi:16S rRNA processing protein RimM